MYDLAREATLRSGLGQAASTCITDRFDQRLTLPEFFRELKIASGARKPLAAGTQNPGIYYAISDMILEDRICEFARKAIVCRLS